jgi:hypothetical protein
MIYVVLRKDRVVFCPVDFPKDDGRTGEFSLLDFVFLGAAELVLTGLSAALGKCSLTLGAVLKAHDRSS